jgi:hypothetical protein
LYFGIKVQIGDGKDNGLIHSIKTTFANVHDLTPAAELLHVHETVVYADAGYQGIEKREEIKGQGLRLPCGDAAEEAVCSTRQPGATVGCSDRDRPSRNGFRLQ